MKFKELSNEAKVVAVMEYIKGWEETHPKNDLDYQEAYKILLLSLVDDEYSADGELLEEV